MNVKDTLNNQDLFYLGRLRHVQKRSKANKRKVGAVIGVQVDGVTFQTFGGISGYNKNQLIGTCEDEKGNTFDNVIHAEEAVIMEALRYSNRDDLELLSEATLYCTYSPCMNCCKLIVLSGIKRLVYCDEHPTNFRTPTIIGPGHYSPYDYLINSGVEVVRILDADIIHY